MKPSTVLDRVRIASPCQASWAGMSGDERVRFCALCEKHVYNISAMPATEATALIEQTEGNLCVRLYRRKDGTVLTTDCPVGALAVARRLRRMVAGAVVGLVGIITGVAYVRAVAKADSSVSISEWSVEPVEMVENWVDEALVKLGIRQPRVIDDGACSPVCIIPSEQLSPPDPAPPASEESAPFDP